MDGIVDLRVHEPHRDVGKPLADLKVPGEGEPPSDVHARGIPLVIVDRRLHGRREVNLRYPALDMGHVPAPEMPGVVAETIGMTSFGREQEAGSLEPSARKDVTSGVDGHGLAVEALGVQALYACP